MPQSCPVYLEDGSRLLTNQIVAVVLNSPPNFRRKWERDANGKYYRVALPPLKTLYTLHTSFGLEREISLSDYRKLFKLTRFQVRTFWPVRKNILNLEAIWILPTNALNNSLELAYDVGWGVSNLSRFHLSQEEYAAIRRRDTNQKIFDGDLYQAPLPESKPIVEVN